MKARFRSQKFEARTLVILDGVAEPSFAPLLVLGLKVSWLDSALSLLYYFSASLASLRSRNICSRSRKPASLRLMLRSALFSDFLLMRGLKVSSASSLSFFSWSS